MSSPFLWLRSFRHAWRGVRVTFRTERSFRIQTAAGLVVLILVLILPLEAWKQVTLIAVSVCVLVLELMNSAVERLVDVVRPRLDDRAADIKDIMAAAVLIASIFAGMIGAVLFWPYVRFLLGV